MSFDMAHGGSLTDAIARHGGRPRDWLDLSTGINPNPVAIGDIPLAAWHRLPERELELRAVAAAAGHFGAVAGATVAVPGTQAAIQHLPRLLGAPATAAVLGPTYSEHEQSFNNAGWRVEAIADPDAIAARHKAVVIVNPNNPDGRLIGRDRLVAITRTVNAHGGTLIVDEAFADFVPEASVADEAAATPGLIVLRSFGKFFGLAGLRLGFLIAADMAGPMRRLLGPWAVSGPALSVAARVYADRPLIEKVRTDIAARRAATSAVLENAGLSIVGDGGLFLLVEHEDAERLHEALGARHVLVRSFSHSRNWLRFGLIGNVEDEARLASMLAETGILSEA
jgi:cobalamin biosynthesis protein CobC